MGERMTVLSPDPSLCNQSTEPSLLVNSSGCTLCDGGTSITAWRKIIDVGVGSWRWWPSAQP